MLCRGLRLLGFVVVLAATVSTLGAGSLLVVFVFSITVVTSFLLLLFSQFFHLLFLFSFELFQLFIGEFHDWLNIVRFAAAIVRVTAIRAATVRIAARAACSILSKLYRSNSKIISQFGLLRRLLRLEVLFQFRVLKDHSFSWPVDVSSRIYTFEGVVADFEALLASL